MWYGPPFSLNRTTRIWIAKKRISFTIFAEYNDHLNQCNIRRNLSSGSDNACVTARQALSHAERSERRKRLVNCDGMEEVVQSAVALLQRAPGSLSFTGTSLYLYEKLSFENDAATCVQSPKYLHNMISIGEVCWAHVSGNGILSTIYSLSNPEEESLTFFVVCALLRWDQKNLWAALLRLRSQNTLVYLIENLCQSNIAFMIITSTVRKVGIIPAYAEDVACHFNLPISKIDLGCTSLPGGWSHLLKIQYAYPRRKEQDFAVKI